MVAYELFVIYASVVALRTGSINMPRDHERLAHAGCVVVGVAGFCGFYFPAARLYSEYLAATDYAPQQAALNSYDGLVMEMVQAWLGLLGLMLAVWIYQRWLLRGLMTEIRAAIDRAEEALMNAVFDGNRPSKSRELLAFRKQGYDEMARPLEAYIAVFIVFGFPALVMALDTCAVSSEPSKLSVSCQHICEMVLAMRTSATACVYFRDPQCRAQLRDLPGLWRRLRQRFCGCIRRDNGAGSSSNPHRVGFAVDQNKMVTIPGRAADHLGGAVASATRPISAANSDSDVHMMGSSAFARLLEMDELVAEQEEAAAAGGSGEGTVGASIPYLLLDEA
jgi:hypothetical protein